MIVLGAVALAAGSFGFLFGWVARVLIAEGNRELDELER